MRRLLLLGLNHTTAALALRERLAFSSEQVAGTIEELRRRFPGVECVLLSTCNRVELYLSREVHAHPRFEEMAEFVATRQGVDAGSLRAHAYEKSGHDVIEHLFAVASSLDSMVVGETQILGQVRDAYESARNVGATGAMLDPLFQRAIAVGREVAERTPLTRGRVSVAGVAVEHARRLFERFDDRTILSIGAGEMSIAALRGLVRLSPRKLIVCSRDGDRARRVAGAVNGIGGDFSTLDRSLDEADIVVTSTGAREPIISERRLAPIMHRRGDARPMFILDLAVPRDVDPNVGGIRGVHLFDLDHLQRQLAGARELRHDAIDPARRIVARRAAEFTAWQQQRESGPVIEALFARFYAIASAEAARTFEKTPGATEADRARLDEMARRIVGKLLHDPLKALRDAGVAAPDAQHASPNHYLRALQQLFKIQETGDARDAGE